MMTPEQSWCRWEKDDLLINLRVQPKAGRDTFVEPYGNFYKVQIKAPPADGKANTHLLRFLAKTFGVRQHDVLLEQGAKSRNKRIRIHSPRKFPIVNGGGLE